MQRLPAIAAMALVGACTGDKPADGAGDAGASSSSSATDTASASPTTTGASTTTSDGTTTADTTADTTAPPVDGSPGCGGPGIAPGRHVDLTLDVDGVPRSYELFVPTGYDPATPAPLVLNFHGLLYTPAGQAEFSGFDASAEPHGMLVAYPAGIGNSFNTGACCGQAHEDGVDDVGFALALVEDLKQQHCIDPRRVHATGMSNGGHMAHLLACVAADTFAAAASVTGVLQIDPAACTPARPISMLDFHGTGDFIVPYTGDGPGYPHVLEMMKLWAARNGCASVSTVTFEQDDMLCETWPECVDGVEVTLCTIDGGGHCWPGPGACPFGANSQARNASDVIAAMFAAHTLP